MVEIEKGIHFTILFCDWYRIKELGETQHSIHWFMWASKMKPIYKSVQSIDDYLFVTDSKNKTF
jgi:hypothetical protein